MGKAQATRLVNAGYSLTVYDLNKDTVNALRSLGATAADSPQQIAEASDVIITMLPSSPHVKSVYTGGLLKSVRQNSLLLDCSTIDPIVAREIASSEQIRNSNSTMLDCPVSGGTVGAEAGTLTFMVGGDKQAFERAKPYLQIMGKNIVYCGPSGSGQVVKLCNNLILGISMIGVSEAMNLGIALGVDPTVLAGVINTSSGRCWSSDTYNPVPGIIPTAPANRNYAPGFMSQLMKKDIGLAVETAKSISVPLPLGNVAREIYELIGQRGYSEKDFSSIFHYLQQMTPKEEQQPTSSK